MYALFILIQIHERQPFSMIWMHTMFEIINGMNLLYVRMELLFADFLFLSILYALIKLIDFNVSYQTGKSWLSKIEIWRSTFLIHT